jgi:hypothetical protein
MNVITLEDTVLSAVTKMAQGNPGACQALMQLMEHCENPLMAILHLDDMQVRGYKIWLGYKDYCKRDINKFYECIMSRDEEMLKLINDYGNG